MEDLGDNCIQLSPIHIMSCYRPRYSQFQRYAYPDPYARSDPYQNLYLSRQYPGQLIDSTVDTYLVNTYAYPISSYPVDQYDPYYDMYPPYDYINAGRVAGLNRGFRQQGIPGIAAYNYAVLR